MILPGYAILCRIASDEGGGYFCAFAVPARDDADARAKAGEHLSLAQGETLQIEDSRPLTPAEADGLAAIRPMGPRVPIPTGSG